jgi:hypothetical protein
MQIETGRISGTEGSIPLVRDLPASDKSTSEARRIRVLPSSRFDGLRMISFAKFFFALSWRGCVLSLASIYTINVSVELYHAVHPLRCSSIRQEDQYKDSPLPRHSLLRIVTVLHRRLRRRDKFIRERRRGTQDQAPQHKAFCQSRENKSSTENRNSNSNSTSTTRVRRHFQMGCGRKLPVPVAHICSVSPYTAARIKRPFPHPHTCLFQGEFPLVQLLAHPSHPSIPGAL